MSSYLSFLPFLLVHLAAAALPLALALGILHLLLFRDGKKTARYALFSLYLCAVWTVVGPPDATNANFYPMVNLIPFVGMIAAPVPTLLNVLLFVPLGMMLPLFWRKFRDGRYTVLCGFLLSLAVELSQLFSGITDIDDLITNTLGTFLGYLIACGLLLCRPELAKTDGTLWERAVLFVLVFCVMFFLAPVLADLCFLTLP